jgi:predicted metal-dependent hydrolase
VVRSLPFDDGFGREGPARLWDGARPVARREPDGTLLVGGRRRAERERALERWYRREPRKAILQIAESEAERLGLAFNRVTVRDQRTRWGFCSRASNLAFNWRLVIAPPAVLRYVVIHELGHLRVPNHSRRTVTTAGDGIVDSERCWAQPNTRHI